MFKITFNGKKPAKIYKNSFKNNTLPPLDLINHLNNIEPREIDQN